MKKMRILTLIVSLGLIFVLFTGVRAQLIPFTEAIPQEIVVAQAMICGDVVNRMPVDSKSVFPAGTRQVFCFTRIDGAEEETEIIHNWYYNGNLMGSVVLPVRTNYWRTWSSKSLRPEWTGEWMVEVLSEDGTALESIAFSIR